MINDCKILQSDFVFCLQQVISASNVLTDSSGTVPGPVLSVTATLPVPLPLFVTRAPVNVPARKISAHTICPGPASAATMVPTSIPKLESATVRF